MNISKDLQYYLEASQMNLSEFFENTPVNWQITSSQSKLFIRSDLFPSHKWIWDFYSQIKLEYKKSQRLTLGLMKKALGQKSQDQFTLVDGTFGRGNDSLRLLAYYPQVSIMGVERSPYIFAFSFLAKELAMSWAREQKDYSMLSCLERLELNHCDVMDLNILPSSEVIYFFDPMFTDRHQKSSQSQLDSQLLQIISGPDTDKDKVFECLKKRGFKRLIVKTALKDPWPPIGPRGGDFVIRGKSVKYSIYLPI